MSSVETSVVRKIGSSCGIILNSKVLFCAGLKLGDTVELSCAEDKIVVSKIIKK